MVETSSKMPAKDVTDAYILIPLYDNLKLKLQPIIIEETRQIKLTLLIELFSFWKEKMFV